MSPTWSNSLPWGLSDLEENAAGRYHSQARDPLIRGKEIRCCIRGCSSWLPRHQHKLPHIACPAHSISMSVSPTYVYDDHPKNFIIGGDLLNRVQKVERWRLGNERSEDAFSWNVFLGLQRLGALQPALHLFSGLNSADEPELYLWGNRLGADRSGFWSRLKKVREELEGGAGIPTEPDVALRVPGQVLLLIEAKFGSPNGALAGKERFGTVQEFLDRYQAREGLSDPLAREWIQQQSPDRVLEQLCRNVIFAQWLADAGERAIVVNLVKEADERDVEARFGPHLAPDLPVTFRRITWEALFRSVPALGSQEAKPLRQYLLNKTDRLRKAFDLDPSR